MTSQVGFGPQDAVWITPIQTMKRIGDSTHHCRSPTPKLNGCDLAPSTRTQFSEQEYSYLTTNKRHVPTPTPATPPKFFTRNPAIYFPEDDKTYVHVFDMFPGLLENLLESGNLFYSATAATKITLGIIQLCFNYFRSALAHTLPGRLSNEMPGSWFIHSCLPVCICGWSICHSFGALPTRHTTWHIRVSQTIRHSKFP